MKSTCTKVFRNIPFAHRLPHHDGRCRFVHGHNWNITLTFAGGRTPPNEFIIDFGKMDSIKEWIDKNLDHALLIERDDPAFELFTARDGDLWKLTVVPCGSTEMLAEHLCEVFQLIVHEETSGRVRIVKCVLEESPNNSARFSFDG